MNKMMLQTAQQSGEQRAMVACYFGGLPRCIYCAGIPLVCTEKLVLLEAYTKFGEYDGIEAYPADEIDEIRTGSRLLHALAMLASRYEPDRLPYNGGAESDLYSLLQKHCADHTLVCLVTRSGGERQEYYGRMVQVSPEALELAVLDEYGNDDGVVQLSTPSVAGLWFDSRECRSLEFLAGRNS